ncbi:MAG TPA: outer membrane lipoprotein carrier protein LolA [Puia sp.]|nr:outer membrane lipoprotein carrier protein LolA [Puia sp.]
MRERILLLCIFCFCICVFTHAQYPGFTLLANDAAFRQQFSEISQKTISIQSDFTQEKDLSMLSEKIVSKGKFWFKKDNRVRMEYSQPFQYLMVLNNGSIYIKDDQKENKVSAKSNPLFRQINKIMVDCMQGSALSNPDFSQRIFEGKSSFLIELTPTAKNLKSFFEHINIIVDKKDFSATEIKMYESGGDNTIIRFTNKQLNTAIPDALFIIH